MTSTRLLVDVNGQGHAPDRSPVPALPSSPCFSVSQGGEPCKLVSEARVLPGFQLGVGRWGALGETEGRGGEKRRRQGVSPTSPTLGGVSAMAVFPSRFQPCPLWAVPLCFQVPSGGP